MRKKKNLYDFGDFESAIDRRGTAVEMNVNDLVLWENGMSSAKYTKKPMLTTTSVVQFRRGENKFYWKSSMDAEEFKEGKFLKKKIAVK